MSTETVEQESEPGLVPGTSYEVPSPAAAPVPPLWRSRDFMLLWSGQAISGLGSAISGIVFPLLVLALTHSPAAAGLAAAMFSLPYLIFSLPIGALIDRWDRKRVMILCDTGRALSVASVPLALVFGVLTVWQLYANAFIEGTLYVFFNIAEVAALSRVVPKTQLPAATAQNGISENAAGLIGPSLGGVLYSVLGAAVPFVFDAVSYAVSVISLALIKTRFQETRAVSEIPRNLRAEIAEGVRWVWRNPLIRFLALLTGANNFANAAAFLLIIVLAQRLGADATAIGTILSIGSVGGLLGSLVGGQVQKRFRLGQVIPTVVWVFGLLLPLYAFAPNVLTLGAITALWLFINPIYNVVQFSYRVALIPDALQGRVNSSFRLIAFGFQPLGASIAGVLIEAIGPQATILGFAAWVLGWAVLATLNPALRHAPPLPSSPVA